MRVLHRANLAVHMDVENATEIVHCRGRHAAMLTVNIRIRRRLNYPHILSIRTGRQQQKAHTNLDLARVIIRLGEELLRQALL